MAEIRMSIEEHEGSTLYADSSTEKTPILVSVYVALMPDRSIRFGGSGPASEQVAAIATMCLHVPGLLEAVVGMKTLFEKGQIRGAR